MLTLFILSSYDIYHFLFSNSNYLNITCNFPLSSHNPTSLQLKILSIINKGHLSISCLSIILNCSKVSNASINLKFQHPFHPPDDPRAFENFILLNTSILIYKTCLFCWKDLMILVQIPHPTHTRFKFPNPRTEKNPFQLNKKLEICFIPTNLMTKQHSKTRRHISIFVEWLATNIHRGWII